MILTAKTRGFSVTTVTSKDVFELLQKSLQVGGQIWYIYDF